MDGEQYLYHDGIDDGMPKENDARALQKLGEDIDGGMPKQNEDMVTQLSDICCAPVSRYAA